MSAGIPPPAEPAAAPIAKGQVATGRVRRARVFRVVQLFVSATLLTFVFRRIDLTLVGDVLDRVHWKLWTFGLALALLAPLAAACRFAAMLGADGYHVRTRSVLAVNLEAMFFSLVLPGDLVGGAIRWARVGQHTGRRGGALGLVICERLLDWAALGICAAAGAGLLFAGPDAERSRSVVLLGGGMLAAAAIGSLAISASDAWPRVAEWAEAAVHGRVATWLIRSVGSVLGGLHGVMTSRALMLRAIGYTALYWLLALTGAVAMAHAVHAELPPLPFIAAMSAIAVVAQLPLTIGGLGLREASLPFLLAAYGVTREVGLVIGLSAFVPGLLLGLAGAGIHMGGLSRLVAADPT